MLKAAIYRRLAAKKFASRCRSLNLRLADEKGKIFMAMYHFRLKSDKKPNGTKISAVQHVEYINREGTFAHDEQWKENNKFIGDFITTGEKARALDALEILLYKTDDFGSIKNSAKGIEVTQGASLTTISIALMLADETLNHQPLILHGSPDFHKRALEATMQANLSISFQDKLMQRELERRRVEKENDSKQFFASTGKIIGERLNQGHDFSDEQKTLAKLTAKKILETDYKESSKI